eukprot:XP_792536.3 PREDICTED: neuronal acetylcholine receptor subunit alpha-9 [Strongylocentrotus purpuratus]
MDPVHFKFVMAWLLLNYLILSHITKAHRVDVNTTLSAESNITTEKELVANLLSEYGDTSVRPVKDHLQPVEVFFRMLLFELITLDETHQMVTVRSNMRLQWTDEYLQWDPDENGGIYNITLKTNQVWRPDVVLDEDLDRDFISIPEADTFVIVQYTGAMDWLFPAITTSACKMNIQYFPFDTQQCVLTFYPWTLDESKMRFFAKNDEDALQARYVRNGIWSMTDFKPENFSFRYICCPYPNDHIRYTLTFDREYGFFLSNIIVPAIFLTSLMLVGFWLHPDSGEKVAFTVTNLLALILFQQLVSDSMPPIGEPRSIIVTCFFMLVVVSGCSVFFSVLVLRMYHHDATSIPPRLAIKMLMPWISKGKNKNYMRKFYSSSLPNITDIVFMNGKTEVNKSSSKADDDQEMDDRNVYLWKQTALAFDSFCGTILSLCMLGTLLYALISFLMGI